MLTAERQGPIPRSLELASLIFGEAQVRGADLGSVLGYADQAGDTRTRAWGYATQAILDTYYATPGTRPDHHRPRHPATSGTVSAGTVMLHCLRSRALAAHQQLSDVCALDDVRASWRA